LEKKFNFNLNHAQDSGLIILTGGRFEKGKGGKTYDAGPIEMSFNLRGETDRGGGGLGVFVIDPRERRQDHLGMFRGRERLYPTSGKNFGRKEEWFAVNRKNTQSGERLYRVQRKEGKDAWGLEGSDGPSKERGEHFPRKEGKESKQAPF